MEARGLQPGAASVERSNVEAASAPIEPRRMMWAVAEVCWADASGRSFHSRATIVDISASGACIRLKDRIGVGSHITIKWHREQFSAEARNCRSDGGDYLLGVRRENVKAVEPRQETGSQPVPAKAAVPEPSPAIKPEEDTAKPASTDVKFAIERKERGSASVRPVHIAAKLRESREKTSGRDIDSEPHRSLAPREAARQERKVMQPKRFFPNFWRRQHEADAPTQVAHKEAPVNKPTTHSVEQVSNPPTRLLSYDDIYHAAGIMSPRSGYGIHKVVDMLNSERIRDLSKEIKRSSVLMALDAAGASVDDLLQDATRRQQALNTYEDGQRKQLEEYEVRKGKENSQIQAEMQRITAHYAERIQQNNDEVANHKEALHNWQMAKQHESQRISEVIELCGKQPASPAGINAMAATAGAGAGQSSGSAGTRS